MDNQEPAEVSHYTSVDVLPEFLKKEMPIYGTHYQFLNDKTEKKYALGKIDAYLKTTKYKDIFEKFKKKDYTVYIASFSTAADDLNLWRAYAPQGGFSIQFDEKQIDEAWKTQVWEKMKKTSDLFPAKDFTAITTVRYTDEDVAAYLEKQKTRIEEGVKDRLNLPEQANNETYWTEKYITYYRALSSCFVKYPAFKDEKEYRAAFVTKDCGNFEMVGGKPRILLITLDPNKAIKSITVSPFGDFSENKLFAQLLCQRIGLKPSIVKKSSLCGIAR